MFSSVGLLCCGAFHFLLTLVLLVICAINIWKNEQGRSLKITLPQFYSFGLYRKLNLAMTLSFLTTTPVTRFSFNDFHYVTRSPFQGLSELQAKGRVWSVNICLLQCSCCSTPLVFFLLSVREILFVFHLKNISSLRHPNNLIPGLSLVRP